MGCSSLPGLQHPRVTVVPQLVLLEFEGDTAMQSPGSGGGPNVNNGQVDFGELGVSERDDEFAGAIYIGDGFSGVDFTTTLFDLKGSAGGTLTENWGNFLAGDVISTKINGFDVRLRYIAQLYEWWSEDEEWSVRLGAGAALGHREFRWRMTESTGTRTQSLDISDDGLPSAAVRAAVGYQNVGLRADYTINPDLSFGGDFEDIQQELELTAFYAFEDQDLKVTAGYRRTELRAAGDCNSLRYDMDFALDGFVFGLELTF